MTFTLGTKPDTLAVSISQGADFNTTLHNTAGNWSGTASIQLRFGSDPTALVATWTATIAGADATFAIDKATVQTVYNSSDRNVRLWYVDGTDDVCWATGSVSKS